MCQTCTQNNLVNEVVCETCDSGYFLYGNSCVECKETFQIIKGNSCLDCSFFIPSCKDCSKITETNIKCDSCFGQNFLFDGNSDGVFEACDKCNEKTKTKVFKDDLGRGLAINFF